mgnify:CR=1 FL=1
MRMKVINCKIRPDSNIIDKIVLIDTIKKEGDLVVEMHYKPCEHKKDGRHRHGHFWEGDVCFPVMIFSTTMGWYYLRVLKKGSCNLDELNHEMKAAGIPDVATKDHPEVDRDYIDVQIRFLVEDEKGCKNLTILENNARILALAGYLPYDLQLAS